jgi:hypothetical protein
MATKIKTERPNSIIKANISPLTDVVKLKIANAVNSVVTAIKVKHLN